ncbi:MAG TPA: hypothetical protein VM165_02175 [Planctomycetaceae bacterium]|nr:hypothetical protein [Planctomycetaceae bacterium]
MFTIPKEVLRVRDAPRYMPTPAEIAAMSAEIREAWTPAETRRRWAQPLPISWFPPKTSIAVRIRGQ